MKPSCLLLMTFFSLCTSTLLANTDDDVQKLWDEIQTLQQQSDFWFESKFKEAIDSGHPDQVPAISLSRSPYDNELFKKKDELQELSRSGNKTAQYYQGIVNWEDCRKLYRDAKTEAELSLADTCYRSSLRLWRPLADAGDADSQWWVGLSYALGKGLPQSPLNAIEWYYKAALGFQRLGKRDRALTILEDMQGMDPKHPLTLRLRQRLLGSYDK